MLCVTGCVEPEREDSLPRRSTQAQALQEAAPAAQEVAWGLGRGRVPHLGGLLGGAADRAVQGPRWEEAAGGGWAGTHPPQAHIPLLSPHLEENRHMWALKKRPGHPQ